MYKCKQARLRKNLTLKEAARLMNLYPPQLHQLESGAVRPYPGYKTRMAVVLGLSVDELFIEVPDDEA